MKKCLGESKRERDREREHALMLACIMSKFCCTSECATFGQILVKSFVNTFRSLTSAAYMYMMNYF